MKWLSIILITFALGCGGSGNKSLPPPYVGSFRYIVGNTWYSLLIKDDGTVEGNVSNTVTTLYDNLYGTCSKGHLCVHTIPTEQWLTHYPVIMTGDYNQKEDQFSGNGDSGPFSFSWIAPRLH